jgi:hypothetical protein
MRRTVLLVSGTALLMGLLTGPANAASAPGSCPLAFEGPATYTDILALQQIQDALSIGLYDEAHAWSVFDGGDHNRDSLMCWKSTGNGDQLRSMYAVNMVDNNAAPKHPK